MLWSVSIAEAPTAVATTTEVSTDTPTTGMLYILSRMAWPGQ